MRRFASMIAVFVASNALISTILAESPLPIDAPQLNPLWVASGFSDPEGVAQAADGSFFISNVNGSGSAKDGNGFISRLSAQGDIIQLRWAEGLNGPKGMAILGKVLYVADIDAVREFDSDSGELLAVVEVPDADFLNDVSVWNGHVYISDSGTARIYRLDEGVVSIWLEDQRLSGVNGLLGDGERLLVSTMDSGSLLSVSKQGEVEEIADGMKNADGIGIVSGGYLVSSWPGQIHFVSKSGAVNTLVDTQSTGTLQNDLSVFGRRVIVPNWRPGTVTAWEL